MSDPLERLPRSAFPAFRTVPTRWADNDIYGHVNNVVYYALFDTAVNAELIARGLLDPHGGDPIFVVAETRCRYFASIAFPTVLELGVGVERMGRSSVRGQADGRAAVPPQLSASAPLNAFGPASAGPLHFLPSVTSSSG